MGEAGLGKSQLCFEFLERCRARGWMTYETTGVAHGKAIPFLPILDQVLSKDAGSNFR
jgi:adenylate cyclase